MTSSPTPKIVPTELDILCGKTKAIISHPGTLRYQRIVDSYTQRYIQAESKFDKMTVTKGLYDYLRETSRFLKFDDKTQEWVEITALAARDKVGHALRFAVNNINSDKRRSKKGPKRATHRRVGSDFSCNSNTSLSSAVSTNTTTTTASDGPQVHSLMHALSASMNITQQRVAAAASSASPTRFSDFPLNASPTGSDTEQPRLVPNRSTGTRDHPLFASSTSASANENPLFGSSITDAHLHALFNSDNSAGSDQALFGGLDNNSSSTDHPFFASSNNSNDHPLLGGSAGVNRTSDRVHFAPSPARHPLLTGGGTTHPLLASNNRHQSERHLLTKDHPLLTPSSSSRSGHPPRASSSRLHKKTRRFDGGLHSLSAQDMLSILHEPIYEFDMDPSEQCDL